MTSLQITTPRNRGSIPSRDKKLLSSAEASGVYLGPIQDAPSSEIKQPGREADNSPPSIDEAKNEWKYTTPTLLHTPLWRAQGFYISHDYDMFTPYLYRVRGGAVGLGTALQAEGRGFDSRWLNPSGRTPASNGNEYQEYLVGG